jgi:hypothetical protein
MCSSKPEISAGGVKITTIVWSPLAMIPSVLVEATTVH